jgi:hypothetical protein
VANACLNRVICRVSDDGVVSVDDGNHDEPEPSGKSQYRDTRFAAAAKDPIL